MSDDSESGVASMAAGLADAAENLENALRRFEELTQGACKVRLNSEKNLARAARSINEAAASQEIIAQALSALVKHINVAQTRQQAASERVFVRAKEIQERTREFEGLMKELIAVGEEAGAITSELQRLSEGSNGASENGKSDLKPVLAAIEVRMADAASRARDVERRAQQGELGDVVRHADSLRQQIEAARAKLATWTVPSE
jgi:chromosome segregation ATPase